MFNKQRTRPFHLIYQIKPSRLHGEQLSDWSTQPISQVIVTACPVTMTFFFKMAPYQKAIMNEDIGKFVYDSMQERAQKDKNH